MKFVEIPAGWFWMGWEAGAAAERPRHRVFVERFAIATHPATNADYSGFVAAGGAGAPPFRSDPRFSAPRQPVVGVNWDEASAYCAWLTATTGVPHRLPTEAEWEKAARGGLEDARYPWGDDPAPDGVGPLAGPPLVAGSRPNGYGLTDLSGCVHEWCLDWHDDGYYAVAPERNPRGPTAGVRRVSRGGAWRHQNPWSPVAHRSSLPPGLRYSDYGFRVVRSLSSSGGS